MRPLHWIKNLLIFRCVSIIAFINNRPNIKNYNIIIKLLEGIETSKNELNLIIKQCITQLNNIGKLTHNEIHIKDISIKNMEKFLKINSIDCLLNYYGRNKM